MSSNRVSKAPGPFQSYPLRFLGRAMTRVSEHRPPDAAVTFASAARISDVARSYEYVCPECGNVVEREYRVPSVVRACENDCGFDHYVRTDLLEKVESVPEADRPDDWDDLDNEEKVYVALKKGVVSLPDLQ